MIFNTCDDDRVAASLLYRRQADKSRFDPRPRSHVNPTIARCCN